MQWGQIKTLFILCFLVLDVFLLHHFINNSPDEYKLTDDMPREENVKNNVNGLDNIPIETPSEQAMLYAQRKELTESDLEKIVSLPNQNSLIIDDHLILSGLKTPVAMNVEERPEALSELIWSLDSYDYFGEDEQSNTHIFFQRIDQPVYFNLSGVLLIHENEKNEVTHYVQTELEKVEESAIPEEINKDPVEISKPFDALLGLYFSEGNIVSGDEITEQVTLGYHNLLPLPNGVQVLAPTWEFEVNNNEFFYVNAIEGHYAKREMASFIEEMKLLIEEYFAVYSTAQIEATNEEWQEQDVENFVQQLLEKFEQKDGVE